MTWATGLSSCEKFYLNVGTEKGVYHMKNSSSA